MKKEVIGYWDENGIFIPRKKIPRERTRCFWSQDGKNCINLAINGYVWCIEHKELIHKINGREIVINQQVKDALIKNE